MDQAASLQVENDLQFKKHFPCTALDLDSREVDFNQNLFNI